MEFQSSTEFSLFSASTPISFTVLSMLPTRDIMSFGLVSRDGYAACLRYLTSAWSFHKFFAKWVTDTEGLRSVLLLTDAVVSGSQALQFFDRSEYPNSDLDIFLRPDRLQTLVQWLLQAGYTFPSDLNRGATVTPTGNIISTKTFSASYPCSASFKVYNFTRNTRTSCYTHDSNVVHQTAMQIQLIVTNQDPVEHILSHFHSSTSLSVSLYQY